MTAISLQSSSYQSPRQQQQQLPASRKVVRLAGCAEMDSFSVDDFVLRRYFHGWQALFNPDIVDTFLYNPISRRRIKLPPIEQDRPAAKEWIPLGEKDMLLLWDEVAGRRWSGHLNSWNLWDPLYPEKRELAELDSGRHDHSFNKFKFYDGRIDRQPDDLPAEHLVVVGRDVPVVTQHAGGGGFDVHRYDPEEEEGGFKSSGLDGWALFIGFQSNAFALPVANFPGLKSNSIYFTDNISQDNSTEVVHIFNYEDKTVSRSYYPSNFENLERILK
ncbi:Unknown protein [Striga hermonthica]|uniref:KIB1-4 beta-propeller domain-containing protein n=1 Tax=Striga hermonthica TaxID=68872 RepID=A0A9N7N7K8_STRHE|nr:Unknown protein [Striga hermonthica]